MSTHQNAIRNICIYCASSSKVDSAYFDATQRLGQLLSEKQMGCICGAGNQGLMGALIDSVIACGGEVIGVIPQFMYDEEWYHTGLSHLEITDTMHERKNRMAQLSDGIIALPGGCGTMEELLEIITWKQLGLYFGPVVILNTGGYYDPLLEMLQRSATENFMRAEHTTIWQVAHTPDEAVELLLSAKPWRKDARP